MTAATAKGLYPKLAAAIEDVDRIGKDGIKLCECGCGRPAPIAKRTKAQLGHVKGQPVRFIAGHQNRRLIQSLKDRIVDGVLLTERDCWQWMGSTAGAGYATFAVKKRTTYVHRVSFEEWRGAIPAGLEIDHLCEDKLCVNPWHLEPVTHAENMRRIGTRRAA
jgi:hypothetical protein